MTNDPFRVRVSGPLAAHAMGSGRCCLSAATQVSGLLATCSCWPN